MPTWVPDARPGSPTSCIPWPAAKILAELRLDPETLAAALLHDVAEDTDFDVAYLRRHFGENVAMMVDGVTKLKRIDELGNMREKQPDAKMESLRKMFLAMVEDVRVVLIKLADRLHNMRTLDGQKPESQQRIARETLEIFAPLANCLGIWQIKWELEDLSFRYLEPETYRQLSQSMAQKCGGVRSLGADRDEHAGGGVGRGRHQGRNQRTPQAYLQRLSKDDPQGCGLRPDLRHPRLPHHRVGCEQLLCGLGHCPQQVAAHPRRI